MSAGNNGNQRCFDALRLSERDLQEIISELDRGAADHHGADLRDDERIAYDDGRPVIRLKHPGGSTVDYRIRVRNISRRGLAFLHGSFVYNNTDCTLTMKSPNGRTIQVTGRIVRCRHVAGNVHEVGIKFDQAIELSEFIPQASGAADELAAGSLKAPHLQGKVLCVDDSPDDCELVRFHLRKLGVHVHIASNADEALALMKDNVYDFVLVDLWLGEANGIEFATALRAQGYPGPVAVLSTEEDEAVRHRAIAAGCVAVLTKPVQPHELSEVLGSYLAPDHSEQAGRSMLSANWSDASMRPLILGYLGRLEGQVKLLEKLLSGRDVHFGKLCLDLKGTAAGFGYPRISMLAEELHSLAAEKADDTLVRAKFNELVGLCTSACQVRKRVGAKAQ